MPPTKRQMALTAELVASVARVVEDTGASPGAVYLTDADYDAIIRDMLAQAPAGDLWLLAMGLSYGSPALRIPSAGWPLFRAGIALSASGLLAFAPPATRTE
jgi:hypothetical protein